MTPCHGEGRKTTLRKRKKNQIIIKFLTKVAAYLVYPARTQYHYKYCFQYKDTTRFVFMILHDTFSFVIVVP